LIDQTVTDYNKHMGGVHSLDSLASVYRIDVRGKKWYWPHYITTIDVLKSAAFKVFKIANPDAKWIVKLHSLAAL